ncbi:MAG: hypothetical protein Q8K99_14490 [Actinomycetota bacterium]|nr:hypothetical protein [Actinomycetota bacterium]
MARETVCRPDRMNVERMIAQFLVIGGGLFWIIAAYAGRFAFQDASVLESVGSAAYPFTAAVVVFGVGLWREDVASLLLFAGSAAVLVWGFVVVWEPVVWLVMATVLIVPMLVAGIAFYLAARMERICSVAARPMSLSGLGS